MKIKLAALTFLLWTIAVLATHAQVIGTDGQRYTSVRVTDIHVQKRYNIFFKINRPEIDSTFKDNGKTIAQMRTDINTTLRLDGAVPDSLLILSTASPDGSYRFNKWLAAERAKSTEKMLLKMFPQFKNAYIRVEYLEEDWDGLMQVLKAHPEFPQREEMIAIINDDSNVDNKERSLRACKQGWDYLVDNYIYALRNSSITISVIGKHDEYTRTEPISPVEEITYTPTFEAPQRPMQVTFTPDKMVWRKMIMQARTNVLIPGMNVGVEFPIKNHWSVGIDYYYPWFVSKENKWCVETLNWFIDGKYWFTGDKYKWTPTEKLMGHAVGVYAGMGYYDGQKIDRGAQGEFIDVGVDYTFGLPVADGKFRMEFNVGLGWILTYYRTYSPSTDYNDLIKDPGIKQRSTSFFGPTRASVSFCVPIRVNTKKPQFIKEDKR